VKRRKRERMVKVRRWERSVGRAGSSSSRKEMGAAGRRWKMGDGRWERSVSRAGSSSRKEIWKWTGCLQRYRPPQPEIRCSQTLTKPSCTPKHTLASLLQMLLWLLLHHLLRWPQTLTKPSCTPKHTLASLLQMLLWLLLLHLLL
jgi:hypothetical protein